MKILKANAGALTNFEVLDFLRSKGAGKDPTRVLVSVAPSEYKVYDYLEESAARDQTREKIAVFMEKSKKYDLAKAEILNIINIRPSSRVELDPVVEECDTRLGEEGVEELAELISEVLPPPPTQEENSEGEDAPDADADDNANDNADDNANDNADDDADSDADAEAQDADDVADGEEGADEPEEMS